MAGRQRTPYLIGRDDARRQLLSALERATPEQGVLVLVSGEAGIGKTRLLEEFGAWEPDALVARGGCVEGVAYAPWTDALWWLLERLGPGVLGELPGHVGPQLARLIPSLTAIDLTAPAAEDGQQLLFDAVAELLRQVARNHRLVLVVDDVHWIDPASRDLLRYVASNLRRIPLMLVAAFRPEDSADERDLVAQLGRLATDRIVLDRLSTEATTEIATLLLGEAAEQAEVARIAHDSDGNPLFIEELVAAAGSHGLPETLRDLMLARYLSLDDDARHLVSVAAVIGPRSPRGWLVHASQLTADRARTAARAAADAGVLVAADGAYAFRHALLRQAVLDELLPDELVEFHRVIAQALQDHPERAPGIDHTAELARHWDAAQAPEPALKWLVAAARHAYDNYAFEASMNAYERALHWWHAVTDPECIAGMDRATLLLQAATASREAGFLHRAGDLAREAMDDAFAISLDHGVAVAGRAWTHLWSANRSEEALAFARERVLPVLERADPQARARFLVGYVQHLASKATPEEVRGPAAEMVASLHLLDDPALEVRARMVNAWCYEMYGEFDRVEPEYEIAADLARRAGLPALLVTVLGNHAASKQWTPDFEGSIALLDAADALIEKHGLTRYRVHINAMRNVALTLLGDLEAAAKVLEPTLELDAEGWDRWTGASGPVRVALAAGDYSAALETLSSVSEVETEDPETAIELLTMRAEALAWLGDIPAARAVVDTAEQKLEEHREAYYHGFFAMVAMRIEGDAATNASAQASLPALEEAHERAKRTLASWQRTLSELQNSVGIIDAMSLGVDAEWARVTKESPIEAAKRAADQFEAFKMRYYATYFRWRMAEAMLASGDRVGATEALKRARAVAIDRGFAGLEAAINQLARTHQLRLGPARTNVDGEEALSVRELEVLRLLVDGRSNPEIAQELFITRRTAAAHVSNILKKLDATSRVEAVSEALRRGYV